MYDLDFHGLDDEIGDAARQPEFAAVRQRTGRLRRRRRLAMAGASLGVTSVLALGGYAITGPGTGPVGPAEASPSAVVDAPARIRGAVAGDADHFYALVADCESCKESLMASKDGGRTWQQRPAYAALLQEPDIVPNLDVLGPRILTLGLPAKLGRSEIDSGMKRKISTDGGATWRDLKVSQTPVAATPPGTRLVDCITATCVLAVDPATGTLAPLATQPALAQYVMATAPVDAGLWVKGLDPATGRPAVAVSHDRGQTWTTAVFTTEPPAPSPDGGPPRMYLPDIATADGRTVYATIEGTHDGYAHLYRSTDGGATWQRTNPDGPPTGLPFVTTQSFVTTDGAHVMLLQEGDTVVAKISPDGSTYAPLAMPGGPADTGTAPTVINDSRYLWHDRQALYLSTDGRNWHRLTPL
jgi:hypothetical protein